MKLFTFGQFLFINLLISSMFLLSETYFISLFFFVSVWTGFCNKRSTYFLHLTHQSQWTVRISSTDFNKILLLSLALANCNRCRVNLTLSLYVLHVDGVCLVICDLLSFQVCRTLLKRFIGSDSPNRQSAVGRHRAVVECLVVDWASWADGWGTAFLYFSPFFLFLQSLNASRLCSVSWSVQSEEFKQWDGLPLNYFHGNMSVLYRFPWSLVEISMLPCGWTLVTLVFLWFFSSSSTIRMTFFTSPSRLM